MASVQFIAVTLILIAMTAWWTWRLVSVAAEVRELQRVARSSRSERAREDALEQSSEATMRMVFDVLLLAGMLLGGVWLLGRIGTDAFEPFRGRDASMEDIVGWVQRGSIALVVLAIGYGLSAAVLPKIFPNEGTRQNAWLSQFVAIGLALTFALSLLVSNDLYIRFRDRIEEVFSEAVFTVLTILALGITVYLAWSKAKVLVRPTRSATKSAKDAS